jgi:hypothetical protein
MMSWRNLPLWKVLIIENKSKDGKSKDTGSSSVCVEHVGMECVSFLGVNSLSGRDRVVWLSWMMVRYVGSLHINTPENTGYCCGGRNSCIHA